MGAQTNKYKIQVCDNGRLADKLVSPARYDHIHMEYSVEVIALNTYPVKSLAGIAVNGIKLAQTGLENDRYWMVIMPNGRFVTQRQIPAMARINTRLDNHQLILHAQGHPPAAVTAGDGSGLRRQVTVCGDQCIAVDEGDRISRWLTEVLHSRHPLRLVRIDREYPRPQSKPELLGAHTSTCFADAAPYLIASTASLDALNKILLSKQLHPVDMRRFRPNIVVRGLPAFAEHDIAFYHQVDGRYSFKNCYPCERCIVTTIDQDSGEKDPAKQPFETLKELNPMPQRPQAPAFADNATLEAGCGQTIRVGDQLVAVTA